MYGIVSVIFIVVIAIVHYQIFTTVQSPYINKEIKLVEKLKTKEREIFATCIDKQLLSDQPFIDMRIMSPNVLSFAVIFDSNPLLDCQQLVYAFDDSYLKQAKPIIKFQPIIMLKALIGVTEIVQLEQGQFTKVHNDKQFVLVVTIKQQLRLQSQQVGNKISQQIGVKIGSIQSQVNGGDNNKKQKQVKAVIQLSNQSYLQHVFSCTFWFSWFNLIGLSLISYYRKKVLKRKKMLILASITILLYLIWLSSFDPYSFAFLQIHLKIIMLMFILLICVKVKLNLTQTLLIFSLTLVNQFTIDTDIDVIVKWIVFGINFFNLPTIYTRQNNEAACFSFFAFFIQYGLNNPLISIVHPLALSFILVNLIFGSTIYQLLQLRLDFKLKNKKTQQRLQSYEVSQSDHLFNN